MYKFFATPIPPDTTRPPEFVLVACDVFLISDIPSAVIPELIFKGPNAPILPPTNMLLSTLTPPYIITDPSPIAVELEVSRRVTIPDVSNVPPIFTFLAIPHPPEIIIAPDVFDIDSVVLCTATIPAVSSRLPTYKLFVIPIPPANINPPLVLLELSKV